MTRLRGTGARIMQPEELSHWQIHMRRMCWTQAQQKRGLWVGKIWMPVCVLGLLSPGSGHLKFHVDRHSPALVSNSVRQFTALH